MSLPCVTCSEINAAQLLPCGHVQCEPCANATLLATSKCLLCGTAFTRDALVCLDASAVVAPLTSAGRAVRIAALDAAIADHEVFAALAAARRVEAASFKTQHMSVAVDKLDAIIRSYMARRADLIAKVDKLYLQRIKELDDVDNCVSVSLAQLHALRAQVDCVPTAALEVLPCKPLDTVLPPARFEVVLPEFNHTPWHIYHSALDPSRTCLEVEQVGALHIIRVLPIAEDGSQLSWGSIIHVTVPGGYAVTMSSCWCVKVPVNETHDALPVSIQPRVGDAFIKFARIVGVVKEPRKTCKKPRK